MIDKKYPKPPNGDFLVKTVGNYEIIMECYIQSNSDTYIRYRVRHVVGGYLFNKPHKTVEEAEESINNVIKLDPPLPVVNMYDGTKGLATGYNLVQSISYFEIEWVDPMPEGKGYLGPNARYGGWAIMTPETEAKATMIQALKAQLDLIQKQIQEMMDTVTPVSEESFTAYALKGFSNIEELVQSSTGNVKND